MLKSQPLAPRVALHPVGFRPAFIPPGWLSLASIPAEPASSFVFGDGSHPTTRLCAIAVDAVSRQEHPEAVLDVGTGTGILARIARGRGARHVWGIDIDTNALDSARRHALLDEHLVPIQLSTRAPDALGIRFNLIVANILEGPLHCLAPALLQALLPGGTLLLSGFTSVQAPALRVRYERLGMRFSAQSVLEEWALLIMRRDSC